MAKILTKRYISYFGPPLVIVSDQGSHFLNELLETFAVIFIINKYYTTAYRPESNGGIEHMHHTLKKYAKIYLQEISHWDKHVTLAQHAYNSTEHEAQHFRVGEMVFFLKKPKKRKHAKEYVGPCKIIGMNYDTHNVKIQKGNHTRMVHINKIKRRYKTSLQTPDDKAPRESE